MTDPTSIPVTSRLPGVGEQLDLVDASNIPVRAIRRRSGDVELHSAGQLIELDAVAASTLGAFISGHFHMSPEIADRLGDVLGGLTIDWLRLEAGDAAVGYTIEELGVRRRTGVTIVAILRGSLPIVAPDPATRLQGRDDLVIAGREADRDRFQAFMRGSS